MSDIETSFPTIMDSCKTDAYSLKNQVLFILKVPAISLTSLRGYHLLPYPVLLTNSSYFYIRPTEPFIFLDDLHTTYVSLPSLSPSYDLIKPHLFLCTFPYLRRDTHQICEAELLSHNTINCVPKIARFTASVYHKVSDNQWIFLLAKEDNILIRYPDGSTKGQHLPRSGILTLQPGTAAYTSDFVLIVPSRNSTTFVTKFHIPNVDLGKFNFPPLYSNISFQVPKLMSLDTAELKKTETSLRDAVAHYNNTKTLEVL